MEQTYKLLVKFLFRHIVTSLCSQFKGSLKYSSCVAPETGCIVPIRVFFDHVTCFAKKPFSVR
ncbi:hypothetical protein M501DRAFT_995093 [Patellaria atrata CBS 101060]|uniref:Uncharacterized protein n=1 Tax=Patellaria atrata CBS 101060 TaxID=1346257 RepID=A0A9P4S873_9PEZI|nr:hypothetical protein M501DRAFT_995093 [Patellaria atrata CBS 101060]